MGKEDLFNEDACRNVNMLMKTALYEFVRNSTSKVGEDKSHAIVRFLNVHTVRVNLELNQLKERYIDIEKGIMWKFLKSLIGKITIPDQQKESIFKSFWYRTNKIWLEFIFLSGKMVQS